MYGSSTYILTFHLNFSQTQTLIKTTLRNMCKIIWKAYFNEIPALRKCIIWHLYIFQLMTFFIVTIWNFCYFEPFRNCNKLLISWYPFIDIWNSHHFAGFVKLEYLILLRRYTNYCENNFMRDFQMWKIMDDRMWIRFEKNEMTRSNFFNNIWILKHGTCFPLR